MPYEKQLVIETRFSMATRKCRYTFSATEKENFNVRGLKPLIREKLLEEPRSNASIMLSNFNDNRQFAAGKERSQKPLMEQTQRRKSMSTKPRKN